MHQSRGAEGCSCWGLVTVAGCQGDAGSQTQVLVGAARSRVCLAVSVRCV